jgi:hypothetical protein
VMLPANISRSPLRQVFKSIILPTQLPYYIASAAVNIRERVIITA